MNSLEILIMEKTKGALRKYLRQKGKNRKKKYMHITNTSPLSQGTRPYIHSFSLWYISNMDHNTKITRTISMSCYHSGICELLYFLDIVHFPFQRILGFFKFMLCIATTFQIKRSLLSVPANTF